MTSRKMSMPCVVWERTISLLMWPWFVKIEVFPILLTFFTSTKWTKKSGQIGQKVQFGGAVQGGPDLGKLPTFSCFWSVFFTVPKQYILNKNAVLIQHFQDFDDLGSFVGKFSHGNLRSFPSNLLRLKTTVYKRFYYLDVWLTPSSLPLQWTLHKN